jgi:hypothetical protein
MTTDAGRPQDTPEKDAAEKTEPEGTIPNTQDGVGIGAGGDNTFEPEEEPDEIKGPETD